MPRYSRKRKRSFKKRKFKKRSYKRRKTSNRRYAISGMPAQKLTKLRWSSLQSITSTAGVLASWTFRANGLDDISHTTTDHHNPFGCDQWTALYDHYKVLGSKITISIVNDNVTTPSPYACGVYLSDGAVPAYTEHEAFIEAKRGQWRIVPPSNDKRTILTSNFSSKKFFNVSDVKDVGKLGAATVGAGAYPANPTEQAHWIVWGQTLSGAVTEKLYLSVVIDFIVMFQEPKDIAQS